MSGSVVCVDAHQFSFNKKVDDSPSFHRSWKDFKTRFGSNDSNYWYGNEKLHQLTKDGGYKLRTDLQRKLKRD